jgi:hypothetical protein
VADSDKPRLAMMMTWRDSANSKATVKPAKPAPMMTTGKESEAVVLGMINGNLNNQCALMRFLMSERGAIKKACWHAPWSHGTQFEANALE